MKNMGKTLLSLLLAAVMLCQTACSGGETAVTDGENTPVSSSVSQSENMAINELRPDGKLDDDAKDVDGIALSSAEDLAKIGNDKKYPLDGNYVLVADIDMSNYGAFTPIGGSASECGIVEGANVFSGTFDGRGHTIYGLKVDVTANERSHVGMFGTVASTKSDSPAVIKNLIIKYPSVTGTANAPATYAVLIGQADGYVNIDNVALISGEVNISVGGNGDNLGFGALIGQCRTQDYTGLNNNGINITNVFSNVDVTGENNGRSNYTSGLIGRIRGSDIGKLSNVLMLGSVYHAGEKSHSIAAGDSHAKVNENVYYRAGYSIDVNFNGKTKSSRSLLEANAEFSSDEWSVVEGRYPMLGMMLESKLYTPLDFVTVKLADGDRAEKVTSNFTLPTDVFGTAIEWNSSDTSSIKIDGENAIVTKPDSGVKKVILTATIDGISRTFSYSVDSDIKGFISFDGDKTLTAMSYSDGTTFNWTVYDPLTGDVRKTETGTTGTFTLDESLLESVVALEADGANAYFYYSNLPSVSITSDTEYYDISKEGYSKAKISIYSTDGYTETAYSGDTQIKLRGNSTAYQAKRPFRLKLSKKADLFGMGESKHWVLLANAFDRTNLRNKLSYDLSGAFGMPYCESLLVNVVYNGVYYGLYELSENIRVDDGRVEVFDWEDAAEEVAKAIAKKDSLSDTECDALEEKLCSNLTWITSGKFGDYTISDYYDTSTFDISGGYLIENDSYFDELSKFITKNEMKMMIKSPESLISNDEMMNYLKTYIQDMENAVYSPNRVNSDGKTYSDYMDVKSFIDFWMVNQIFKNVELLFKSCYMYKDVGGKLYFGPIWDMDWTSGNHVNLHGDGSKYNTWWHSESQDREYWYRALYNDPNFILLMWERWQEIGGNIDNMFAELDSLSDEIKPSADVDNSRWWYDMSYSDEVKRFKKWMTDRRNWMNEQFATPETLINSFGYFKESKIIKLRNANVEGDELVLDVKMSNKFTKCEVMINGVTLGDFTVEGGNVRVPADKLKESGKYNAIEVMAKNNDGTYSIIQSRRGQNGSSAIDAAYIFYMSK